MKGARPDLSISIVNHNGKRFLGPLLDSIYAHQGHLTVEILLVDNASSDGSVPFVRERYPEVILTANPVGLYYTKGANQNLAQARGRYILLINEDTLVPAATLQGMVDYLDQQPEVGALGPQLRHFDQSLQVTCNRFPTIAHALCQFLFIHTLFPNNPVRRWNGYAGWDRTTAREVEAICGEGLMVRREILEKIGPLDEANVMYNDEVDWCYRIRQAGWKVVYEPRFQLLHYGAGATMQEMPWLMYRMMNQSFLNYYKKFYGWPVYAALKPLAALSEGSLRLKRLLWPKRSP